MSFATTGGDRDRPEVDLRASPVSDPLDQGGGVGVGTGSTPSLKAARYRPGSGSEISVATVLAWATALGKNLDREGPKTTV